MFNHGVNEVQDLLKANGIPKAEFNVSYLTAFSVVVKEPNETSLPKLTQVDNKSSIIDNETVVKSLLLELSQVCPSVAQVSPKQIITVLDRCKDGISLAELMEALSASSRRTFVRRIMLPFMEDNLVKQTHPDNPRHPQQKYVLTEKGKEWLDKMSEL